MITIGLNLLLPLAALVLPVLSSSFHLAHWDTERRTMALPVLTLHLFGHTLNLLIIVSVAGWLHIGSLAPLRVYLLLAMLILIIWFVVKGQSWRRPYFNSIKCILGECLPGSIVMTVCLLPALLVVRSSGNRFGFATLFNGDIANYSLVADNVAKAGFGDSMHIMNANYGVFASQTSSGGTAVINYLSAITGLRSWQVLMGAMAYVIFLTFVALKSVARSVWPPDSGSHLIAAAVAVMIPLSSLLVGQYFLNHLLGIAACALGLAALISLSRDQTRSTIVIASLTAALALAVYVNGTFGLPFIVSSGFLVPLIYYSTRDSASEIAWPLNRRMMTLATCVVLSLTISAPAIKAAIATLRSQSDAKVGYPLDHLGAFGALVWPSWIGSEWENFKLSPGWQLGSWVLAVGIAVVFIMRSSRRYDRRIAFLAIVGVALAGTSAVTIWGNGRYQTWKLWSFMLPIAVVIALPALWSARRDPRGFGRMAGLIAVGMSATAPMATWKSEVWVPSAGQSAQASLIASLRSVDNWGLGVVNVNLDPYLETMIAGTVLDETRVALSSGSYVGGPITIDSTCTFTKLSYVSDPSQGIKLAGDYILMPVPAKCGRNLPWPG